MDQDQEHRQTVERLNGGNSMNDYCPAGSMQSEMKKMNKGKREKAKCIYRAKNIGKNEGLTF